MIIEFSFGNFRSFQGLTTLSMVAAPIHSKDKELDENNVFKVDGKLSLLKSKAIYGANESGKSNIVLALAGFLKIVQQSVKNEAIIQQTATPFLLSSEAAGPSFFQITFISPNGGNPALYRYGFDLKNGKIESEWLFEKSGRVEVPYFTREGMVVQVRDRYKEARKFGNLAQGGDSEIFRDNSLFLAAVATMGGLFSKETIRAITGVNIVPGLNDPRINKLVTNILQDPEVRQSTLQFMRNADFDIERIGIIENDRESNLNTADMPETFNEWMPNSEYKKNLSIQTTRAVYDATGLKTGFETHTADEWDSEGTRKFLYLAPFVVGSLKSGHPLVIDEFDARLHPLLSKKIVQLFNSKITNPKGAQLIFVTHDTNLLKPNLLRRDQVCFVSKDKLGVSTLRTLVEYKGVRNDASYDKDYLSGKYEAVPFLNNLDHISEN